ncbi:unnamed protein product [Meloidogyne enterolobii]|uniref:Uncharacterized protein n=1 Tax=Meloidogyne enterolobii TaxID=390850 RepID=A0ACB0ZVM8_MELEN
MGGKKHNISEVLRLQKVYVDKNSKTAWATADKIDDDILFEKYVKKQNDLIIKNKMTNNQLTENICNTIEMDIDKVSEGVIRIFCILVVFK